MTCPFDRDFNSLLIFICKVTDKGIRYLGRHCKKLQELYVGSCFGVTDDGIQAVLKGCSELQTLDISKCYSVSDDGLRLAIVNPGNLSLIRLTGCLKVHMCITNYVTRIAKQLMFL